MAAMTMENFRFFLFFIQNPDSTLQMQKARASRPKHRYKAPMIQRKCRGMKA